VSSDLEISTPSSDRTSQSTRVEQARAMAEVRAAMAIAMENPRSTNLARSRMHDSCNQLSLAERAFFRFPRSGGMVTGPTVHLARDLARCWGNIVHSVKELYRNDLRLESEMMAAAWDIETNTRVELGFIVPHKRDVRTDVVAITSMRDIYENNANAGARRLREAIFGVLPLWFKEEAQELCRETLQRGANGDKPAVPLQVRKDKAIEWFSAKGITREHLEDKLGEKEGRWRPIDVAQLVIITQSLQAGETTLEMEFPHKFTRAADIEPATPTARPAPTKATVEQWRPEPESVGMAPVVPAGYVCDVCQAVGEHFQDVCPTLQNDSGE
jgi:hypothetical protein